MRTVEELREMLNEVKGTIEEFKDFEATTEKIVEAKLIIKMEKIQGIFKKYQEIFEELSKFSVGINVMNYFSWYAFNDGDYEIIIAKDIETNSIVPLIRHRNYSYLIRFEANSKFTETIMKQVQKYYSTEKKSTTTISKSTAKNLIISLNLNELEEKIVKSIEYVLNLIDENYKKQKVKIIKNLEGLKDISFINLNDTMDLPVCYIHLIKDCLEGVKKFQLASLIGYDINESKDVYAHIDEILDRFINPLAEADEDVKIIREEA